MSMPYILFLLFALLTATANCQTIPIIDLSPWTTPEENVSDDWARAAVVEQVAHACREIGFFAVLGHAVNQTTVERAWTASRHFFDLPDEIKLLSKTNNETEYPYGYEQSERLHLGKQSQFHQEQNNNNDVNNNNNLPADLKETFSIGPENPAAGMPLRRFPSQQPSLVDFESALTDYYNQMETLAMTLLRIFARALDLPQDWFHDKMTHHMSALRILNYFAVEDRNDLPPNAIRASAHTDYGPLTILKSGGPGLQVKKDLQAQHVHNDNNNQNNDDGDDDGWANAPFLKDAFIINIGDLMQRWTNDKWVSTLHRVILPEDVDFVERRQSIAFFVNVNGDTMVEPIESCVDQTNPSKYPPIAARDHLMAKHLASMGIDVLSHATQEARLDGEL